MCRLQLLFMVKSQNVNACLPIAEPAGGRWEHSFGVTNVEYTEFERLGISDGPAAASSGGNHNRNGNGSGAHSLHASAANAARSYGVSIAARNGALRSAAANGVHGIAASGAHGMPFASAHASTSAPLSNGHGSSSGGGGGALSPFPANTNILYVGLDAARAAVGAAVAQRSAGILPGLIFNKSKTLRHTCPLTGRQQQVRLRFTFAFATIALEPFCRARCVGVLENSQK